MNSALDDIVQQPKLGEKIIADGIDALVRRWQASTTVIGQLCTGTERWQAALRQIQTQTQVNLAEIFRSRTIL
jgi:hypothetical protein